MKPETVAILNLCDTLPNFSREDLLDDLQYLLPKKAFYSAQELSDRYGVTTQTLKNWEAKKALVPDFHAGAGCVRYSAAVVAAFEKNNPEKGA